MGFLGWEFRGGRSWQCPGPLGASRAVPWLCDGPAAEPGPLCDVSPGGDPRDRRERRERQGAGSGSALSRHGSAVAPGAAGPGRPRPGHLGLLRRYLRPAAHGRGVRRRLRGRCRGLAGAGEHPGPAAGRQRPCLRREPDRPRLAAHGRPLPAPRPERQRLAGGAGRRRPQRPRARGAGAAGAAGAAAPGAGRGAAAAAAARRMQRLRAAGLRQRGRAAAGAAALLHRGLGPRGGHGPAAGGAAGGAGAAAPARALRRLRGRGLAPGVRGALGGRLRHLPG